MLGLPSLKPQIVYSGNSEYNKEIKVIKVGTTYKLVVNGIAQSYSRNSGFAKSKVWGQVVNIIIKNKPQAKNVLLLGMGGGTMVHMLIKKFPNISIVSVEIDKVIVELANKYFGTTQIKNNRTIVADAADVVENPEKYNISEKFDCIIIDTYFGGQYTQTNSSLEFLQKMCDLAEDNALIVLNKILHKTENRAEISDSVENELNSILNTLKLKKIKFPTIADNYIFYGFKKEHTIS